MEGIRGVCDVYLGYFADHAAALGEPHAPERSGSGRWEEIKDVSHALARDLLAAVPASGGAVAATAILHGHRLHSEFILQSEIIRHALLKPRGYAGDMELMLMLCDGSPRGTTPFARAVNDVFVQLPCAQAVRARVAMLGRLLERLPDGSRVLNLACGPALEVQRLLAGHPDQGLHLDLVDHDRLTRAYLQDRLPSDRVRILAGNAFRIMSGDLTVTTGQGTHTDLGLGPGYDLIYSAGLYDYLPDPADGVGGAPELTKVLFSLLNPGGLLLVGNYLQPGHDRGHQPHVRAMMELYSRWYLRYRSADEIADFASTIEADHTLTLLGENGDPLASSPHAVIGFAAIQAT